MVTTADMVLEALTNALDWLEPGAYPNDYDPEWKLLHADVKEWRFLVAEARAEAANG